MLIRKCSVRTWFMLNRTQILATSPAREDSRLTHVYVNKYFNEHDSYHLNVTVSVLGMAVRLKSIAKTRSQNQCELFQSRHLSMNSRMNSSADNSKVRLDIIANRF